ncbi:hypothetical protein JKP88DRAFT_241220 [Tribonema minus]|uniref:Treble clef zinc finger domain-containing protein n=1 Tax=Tribonema minus TaxID=303371 RepID=A0A836CDZ1_9STRA|nr:hypothetical protein JKP88DRAFT_241220 [Tribonema minus]
MSKKCCIHQSLLYKFPGITNQLHPTRNGDLDPSSKPASSNDTVDWLCICDCGEEHIWSAKINNRTSEANMNGCPICSLGASRESCRCKSLGMTNPKLCAEIDMENDRTMSSMSEKERWDFLFRLPSMGTQYLLWKCDVPEHESWEAQVYNRNGVGSGCPRCKSSKLERDASAVLEMLGYKFTREFRFPNSAYRYDFLVHETASTPPWLLEMDGTQHFVATSFGSNTKTKEEMFLTQRKRDIEKDGLAQISKVHMLRIPHTHAAIEEIKEYIEHFLRVTAQHTGGTLKMCVNGKLYDEQPTVEQLELFVDSAS